MKRTKKFATDEQVVEIKALQERARTTPVIALSSAHALRGGMTGDVYQQLTKAIHKHALSAGLPEVPGYYGIDLSTKEFLVD